MPNTPPRIVLRMRDRTSVVRWSPARPRTQGKYWHRSCWTPLRLILARTGYPNW